MMDEQELGGIPHSHLHTINSNNEDSNGSRDQRFMIHRRMSNTGIDNISTINSNPGGGANKRRNI